MADNLLELIRQKQEEIARLQSELDEARKLLIGNAVDLGRQNARELFYAGSFHQKTQTREASSVDMSAQVLATEGEPMHVSKLMEKINRRFNTEVRYATLVSALSRAVKAERTIARFGRNVFGLREWERPSLQIELNAPQ